MLTFILSLLAATVLCFVFLAIFRGVSHHDPEPEFWHAHLQQRQADVRVRD